MFRCEQKKQLAANEGNSESGGFKTDLAAGRRAKVRVLIPEPSTVSSVRLLYHGVTPQSRINGVIPTNTSRKGEQWMEHFQDILNQPDPSRTYDFSLEASPNLYINLDDIMLVETKAAIKAL